jgi:hypothetical protein
MDSHWDSSDLQEVSAMTFPSKQGLLYDPNIWLADSAASTHSTAHLQGMTNLQPDTSANVIQVGNAAMNQVQFIGNIPGTFFDKSGNYVQSSTLHQVSFSHDSIFNLLSFPQLKMQGWSIVGMHKGFIATNPDGTIEIPFDIVIHMNAGCVFATCYKHRNKVAAAHADGREEAVAKTISVNLLHVCLGHCSEEMTHKTAKQLGIMLTKTLFKLCAACGMGESKQKNVPMSHKEEVEPGVGERLHGDISIIRKKE